MSNTGKPFVNFTSRQLVEVEDLRERFFEFLNTQLTSSLARIYNNQGVFDTTLDLTSPGINQFSVVGTSLATDGLGNILDVNGSFAYCQAVGFENEAAVDYEVSLHVAEGPELHSTEDTISVNPRTGAPSYRGRMNYIGELGSPDSVDVLGNTITLVVDSLCESGVTHAGRFALVYLKTPSATTSDVGLQVVEIQYVAGENVVIIANTLLGQTIASTNPSDYEIIVLGPTVRRNSSKEFAEGYVIIGDVTGSGAGTTPSSFSTTQQDLITVSLSEISNSFANFVTEQAPSVSGAGPKTSWDATRYGFAAAETVGNNIYIFGGVTGHAGSATFSNQIRVYDIDGDSWTSPTTMTASLCGCATQARNSTIYVAGGHNASGAVTTVRRYDTVSDAWLTDAAPLPAARAYGSLIMSTDGALMYYIGGSSHAHNAAAAVQREVYVYDVGGDSWSTLTSIPALTLDPAGAPNCIWVEDEKSIFLLGGSTFLNASTDGVAAESCAKVNVSTLVWTNLADAPLDGENASLDFMSGSAAYEDVCAVYGKPACFQHNGVVHFIGGDRPTSAMSTNPPAPSFGGKHSVYSILNDEWTVMPKIKSAARYGTASALHEGVLYSFKGVGMETSGVQINGRQHDAFGVDLNSVFVSNSPGAALSVEELGGGINSSSSQLFQSNMEYRRTRFASIPFCGGVLMVGGIDDAGDALEMCSIYWPQTDTEQVIPFLPGNATRYDHKLVKIEQNGEEAVFCLPGKLAPASDVVDSDIFLIQSSNAGNGWVDLSAYLTNAPDRSSYAVGIQGTVVNIIGGISGTGASPNYSSQFDLATNLHVNDGSIIVDTWNVPTSSVQIGDQVYIATDTGSLIFLKHELSQNTAGSGDRTAEPYGAAAAFTSTELEQPGMAVWDGKIFVVDKGGSNIVMYNPMTQSFSNMPWFSSLPTNTHGSELQAIEGMLVHMGGSSTNGYLDATSTVTVYSIANSYIREKKPTITNFKTKQSGVSVGFKAGQPYGSVFYDDRAIPSYVLMGNEIQ